MDEILPKLVAYLMLIIGNIDLCTTTNWARHRMVILITESPGFKDAIVMC